MVKKPTKEDWYRATTLPGWSWAHGMSVVYYSTGSNTEARPGRRVAEEPPIAEGGRVPAPGASDPATGGLLFDMLLRGESVACGSLALSSLPSILAEYLRAGWSIGEFSIHWALVRGYWFPDKVGPALKAVPLLVLDQKAEHMVPDSVPYDANFDDTGSIYVTEVRAVMYTRHLDAALEMYEAIQELVVESGDTFSGVLVGPSALRVDGDPSAIQEFLEDRVSVDKESYVGDWLGHVSTTVAALQERIAELQPVANRASSEKGGSDEPSSLSAKREIAVLRYVVSSMEPA